MELSFKESERLFEEAQILIPGGVTSARHPIKFVRGNYPIFFNKGKGSHAWDVDGNEYIDWICSFGPLVLGHNNPKVEEAVRKSLSDGFCFTMVHPIQNELAKVLIDIIPSAEMAKFFISGSDATSAAIRMARIFTGREKIVRWGYHGWHDWCYGGDGSDRQSVGVPEGIKQDILTFSYNDLNSLEELFKKNKGNIAGIIMQPFESSKDMPEKGFLEGVKRIAHENGAVLIFDEIRSGFRVAMGGAQEYFGVTPDLTTVSKALANGYPISAVVGRRDVMMTASQTRFSATFMINAFPMYAALATIKELQERDGIKYMWNMGQKLMDGLSEIMTEEDVPFKVSGLPPIPTFKFTDPDEERRSQIHKVFYSELVKRGVIFHPNHHWFLSLAHTNEDLEKSLEASRESIRLAKGQFSR